jgi:Tfp pilus assembly protein PilO
VHFLRNEFAMRPSLEKQITALGWLWHGVGVATLIAVIATYLYFIAMPLAAKEDLSQQRIAQLDAMLRQANHVQSDHTAFQAELTSLKQSVQETQRRLPRELREDEFLAEVRQVATKTGIELGLYQLGMVEEMESYSKADLTFQCQGNFASICRFLDEIDHFARITEISNLQIETSDNFNRYPLQVTFVLYFGGSNHDRSMSGEAL